MSKHTHTRSRRKRAAPRSNAWLWVCLALAAGCLGLLGLQSLLRPSEPVSSEEWRPQVGQPPYRVAVDAGHGGEDPGARGIVQESQMTAATAAALTALLEQDPNYIPLATRESYNTTAKPAQRTEYLNPQSPQLLLSIHGNSAPEGVEAAGFECYPTVPGRTWHRESFYFAQLLAQGMEQAGAALRGQGGVRYIYYQGQTKLLVEASRTEVRPELSFTILEQSDCPAVLAEQCFVTSAEDVARFGDEEGCRRAAHIYYEAICAYFGTQPREE